MTTEQAKRTRQALIETLDLIAKESSYLPQHQKADRLAWLGQHAAKLSSMLEGQC